jgi:anti-sigma factor RsiW
MTAQQDEPPSVDQLLAMAYADGELDEPSRAAFEARMAREPQLAREVVGQQRLAILARSVAPMEPEDHEWARMELSSARRAAFLLAWGMITIGVVGVTALCEIELLRSDAPISLKVFVTLIVAGGLLLFGLVLRGRLRTSPFDPYVDVRR